MKNTIKLFPKPPFSFIDTANSHGWSELAPNSWDSEQNILTRVERLDNGLVTLWEISGSVGYDASALDVTVNHSLALSDADEAEIRKKVHTMFRLDEDFSEFYDLCLEYGGVWIKITQGRGRLLASPSVFEDVVRTIATTNVQWGGTRGMLKRLTAFFGEPFPDDPDLKAFPTPEAIAVIPFDDFAGKARMGYRSEYVHTLARQIAAREVDLEAFRDPGLTTEQLRKQLLSIKGVGAYAAATLLTLLGHYDELPIDTVFRTFVAKQYFSGEYPGDKKATSVYEKWGKWKYLAYWFEIWDYYSSGGSD